MADIPWSVRCGRTDRARGAHGNAVRRKSELCVDDRIHTCYLCRSTGGRERRIGTSISWPCHNRSQTVVSLDSRAAGLAAPRSAVIPHSVCLLFLIA